METVSLDVHRFKSKKGALVSQEFALFNWSSVEYEGESISNQPKLFPIDRDGHDFHALFQYMFYT